METKEKQLYQDITEFEQDIYNSNIDKLKHFFNNLSEECNFSKCVKSLKQIPNLIIPACKYNKLECVKYLLKETIDIVIKVNGFYFKPEDEDRMRHNAFYYAIRNSNVEIFDFLINNWPKKKLMAYPEYLDNLLSTSYQELTINKVYITDEMKVYVVDKLVTLRFLCTSPESEINNKKHLYERRELLSHIISSLNSLSEVDEKCLHMLTSAAKNIYVLKRILKYTYDKLPWEEIEFCCVAFVLSYKNNKELHLLSRTVLNLTKIKNHLEIFLEQLNQVDFKEVDFKTCAIIPEVTREEICANIVEMVPQFDQLYQDFKIVRDLYSLNNIKEALNLAQSADPLNRDGRLVVFRSLQITGEHLKNSLETPKLSKITIDLILLTLPPDTKKIIINIRNALSHSHSLLKRKETEKCVQVFYGIQKDLKRVYQIVVTRLVKMKSYIFFQMLKEITQVSDISRLREIVRTWRPISGDQDITKMFEISTNHLYDILMKLSQIIEYKTDQEEKMFRKLLGIVQNYGKDFNGLEENCIDFHMFSRFQAEILDQTGIDESVMRFLQAKATVMLSRLEGKHEGQEFTMVRILIENLFKAILIKSDNKREEVIRLMCEAYAHIKFGTVRCHFIEELSGKISGRKPTKFNSKRAKNYNNSPFDLILLELKNVLEDKGISKDANARSIISSLGDKGFVAAVQLLSLDLLSIWDSQKKLDNNFLSLDDNAFVLTGKCYRNYLAHCNRTMDILLEESDLMLIGILNAVRLVEGNSGLTSRSHQISSSRFKAKVNLDRDLLTLDNKWNILSAIENGNLESVNILVGKGAEVCSRDLNLRTCLHYACRAPNISVLKFLLGCNVDKKFTSEAGESILHVAAEYGRTDAAALLIEVGLKVDILDNRGRSPLHIASMNNHKDTVVLLINNKANLSLYDEMKKMPLHYAYESNYKDIVLLLEKEQEDGSDNLSGNFTSLHVAASKGYLELVEHLITRGADVNSEADKGGSPLLGASLNGHYSVVKVLLAHGADVNVSSFIGHTPLYNASGTGRYEIVELLLQNKADVNATDTEFGVTPLIVASSNGHNEVVKLLLSYKADASKASRFGESPMIAAIKNNHKDIVSTLFDHGVNINTRTFNNWSFLHYVAQSNSTDILNFLIEKGASVNCRTNKFLTPLHLASSLGNSAIIDILIKNEAQVNAEDDFGWTPLHKAAKDNFKDAVILLIRNKAEVNYKNNDGNSPLHLAASKGAKDVAQVLLQNSADVNLTNDSNFTPLHRASKFGHKDIADLCITHGADINACVSNCLTPLFLAVEGGHVTTINLLIEKGASFNSRDESKRMIFSAIQNNRKDVLLTLIDKGIDIKLEGPAALLSAIVSGSKVIVDFLLKHKIKNENIIKCCHEFNLDDVLLECLKNEVFVINLLENSSKLTPLLLASSLGQRAIVESLLSMGADPNDTGSDGYSPLHLASSSGHLDVVEVLLKVGAEINSREYDDNKTPFELAIVGGHVSVVDLFLEHQDIKINDRGNDEWTPLHLATRAGKLDIVINLVEHGADLNFKNSKDSKPIHIAARCGHKDIVKYFLGQGMSVDETSNSSSLLHHATVKGHLEVVKLLIENHANPNSVDENGYSPLHYAAQFGDKDIVKCLLNSGCCFNSSDNRFKMKPVEIATNEKVKELLEITEELFLEVKKNNSIAVDNLAKRGAAVNACSCDSGSALHYAAWKGFNEVANSLLKNNCNPNIRGKNGFCPLHYAVKFSRHQIVFSLLFNGAVFNPISDTGKTPLDVCKDKKLFDLIKFVENCFKKVRNKDNSVVCELGKIKDSNILKAVMKAHDRDSKSLTICAVKFDFPKIEELKQILEGDFTSQVNTANQLFDQEKYDQVSDIYNDILKSRKETLAENQPGIIDAKKAIATTLYKKHMYDESLKQYKSVYEKQKKIFGEDHAETLNTNREIALVLHRMGKNEESLSLFEKVCRKQKEVLGSSHEYFMETQSNMALVLMALDRHKEALKINYEVLDYRIKIREPDNKTLFTTYNNIAISLNSMGRYNEAIEFYKKAYEGRVKTLGPTHSDTLRTQHNIATVLLTKNETKEALKLLNNVLEKQKKFLGPRNRDVFNTQNNIAFTLLRHGNLIGAFKLFRECYNIGIEIYGHHHFHVNRVENYINLIKQQLNSTSYEVEEIFKKIQRDFILAVNRGDTSCIADLIRKGAFVNESNAEGRTPLHFAVSRGDIKTISILIENGADVTLVSDKGNTPLHIAVSNNRLDIVKILFNSVSVMQLYAFANAKTKAGGTTALHVAAKNGSLEIVGYLLNRGACYDLVNAEGKTPLELSPNDEVSTLLKHVHQCFNMVKSNNKNLIEILEMLDQSSFNSIVSSTNSQGKTLVQYAFEKQHILLAELLNAIHTFKSNVKSEEKCELRDGTSNEITGLTNVDR